MKKLLLLVLPFCGAFAQHSDIRPGEYESHSMGADFLLRIHDNQTYELVFLRGDFEKQGDTLHLNTNKAAHGDFVVTPIARDKNANALTVTFRGMTSRYFLNSVYIGTQHSDSRPPEYKSARDYIKGTDERDDEFTASTPVSVKIDKTKFLYLLNYKNYFTEDNSAKPTIISKFEIPDDVSEVDVDFDFNRMSDMKFRIYQDKEGQLVMTEGKSPLTFVFKGGDRNGTTVAKLQPQLIEDTDFAKNAGIVADRDELLEGVIEDAAPSYAFKYAIEQSFAAAQKTTAKSKDKFLVVYFDYENKRSRADFDAFIKLAETDLGYAMGEAYVESVDHFNFYLASDKDKALLAKNRLDAKKPQILVYNAAGDLIYHTSETLKKSMYFRSYNSAYADLKQADEHLKFDRTLSNKKAAAPELVKAFNAISKTERIQYETTVADSTTVDYETELEVVPAVDTVAAAYSDYARAAVIRDRDHLYKLKATPSEVRAKWLQIVQFYKKSNAYNQDYIDTGLSELLGDGFNSRLFNDNAEPDAATFDFLDYVFLQMPEIKKAEAAPHQSEDAERNDIDSVLGSFFGDHAYTADQSQQDKISAYYKKYIALSGGNPALLQAYFYFVQNGLSPKTEREYLDSYADFFNSVIKPESGVIENLDRAFGESFSDHTDWQGFKYEFSNSANTVAWYVVEHKLGKPDLEKAIRWSEVSHRIDSKNAYFLDTLAQLYYLNGQKQKAIATEERAASAAAGLDDPAVKLQYEEILEKMKKGTY
ncbi:hypothetical protein [Flavobacterium magnum]|nr:hypothetical protein [Flavobacterium magnum]